MPSRLYMQIDTRRDHSLRVPRPDLSLAIGTPNACTGCHADRSDAWAQAAVLRWWGPARASRPHYGLALHAGRRRLPGAEAALLGLAADASAPGIARATALRLLRGVASPRSLAAMAAGSRDPDPLVRLAAAEAGAALPARERLALAAPLLRDPILGVRIEAALGLSELPPDLWAPGDRSALAAALAEYRAAQRANQDFPEAHVALGALHARFGELEPARAEYDEALALEPAFVPARVNLADLHRQAGRDDEALRELERARELAPESADVLHALGLALVRVGRAPEAVAPLARAAELAPDEARYAYVHAIALHSTGDPRAALAALARAHDRHPGDREILVALARISGETGDAQAAARWAGALLDLAPDDPSARALADELGAASPRPD
jgi:Flp pilus assembly protein TadD